MADNQPNESDREPVVPKDTGLVASTPGTIDSTLDKVSTETEEVLMKAILFGSGRTNEESAYSKQLPPDRRHEFGEVHLPLFDPTLWARMMEMNTRLSRSIRSYARNTVGLGWAVEPLEEPSSDTPDAINKAVDKQATILRRFFNRPNQKMPTTTVFYLMKTDMEATGNGYLEITRNNGGQINGLFHVSSVTIRVRKNDMGFVQIREEQRRYFKEFGDIRIIDPVTGDILVDEYGNKTTQGFNRAPTGIPIPEKYRASEILHFKIYSPRSSYYGVPRFVSAAPAITGSRLAAVRNVAFMENDGVPRMVIAVSGGRLTSESVELIEQFVSRKGRGVENAHRVMVLQTEEKSIGLGTTQGPKSSINVTPVGSGIDDASFQNYRKNNDDEIREAFGISDVFYRSDTTNRACLVGDTRVPLLDGRTVSMLDLVKEYGDGQSFWVYAMDDKGHVVPGRARNPRLTKSQVPVWEVLLDNGETVRGTPDHLFMRLDGTYTELAALKPGDRLKPLYRSVRPRVRKVGPVGVEDVYDISVDGHHNFALHAGVFVHNSASIAREITNEQEFEPDRLEIEYCINQTLIPELMPFKDGGLTEREEPLVAFKFNRPLLEDPLDTAHISQVYANLGALTPNELRGKLGKRPYPNHYLFADRPLTIGLAEIQAGSRAPIHNLTPPEARKIGPDADSPGPGGPSGGPPGGPPGGGGGGENPLAAMLGGGGDGKTAPGIPPIASLTKDLGDASRTVKEETDPTKTV